MMEQLIAATPPTLAALVAWRGARKAVSMSDAKTCARLARIEERLARVEERIT